MIRLPSCGHSSSFCAPLVLTLPHHYRSPTKTRSCSNTPSFESGVVFNSGNDLTLASSQRLSYDDRADSPILVHDIEEGHLRNREIKFDQFGSFVTDTCIRCLAGSHCIATNGGRASRTAAYQACLMPFDNCRELVFDSCHTTSSS